jgi:hypothetical protein
MGEEGSKHMGVKLTGLVQREEDWKHVEARLGGLAQGLGLEAHAEACSIRPE